MRSGYFLDNPISKEFEALKMCSDGSLDKQLVKVIDTNEVFLVKWPKRHASGAYTYEDYSEYLAYLIGNEIGVDVVDIMTFNRGIISKYMYGLDLEVKSFVEYSEELLDSFHMSNLKTFSIDVLLDYKRNEYVSETIQMLLYDALIGNSDRHPLNFGYTNKGFYPLFDNGSSLLAYVKDEDVKSLLSDKMRFNAAMITKSKPVVRSNLKITHKQLVDYIRIKFPKDFREFQNKLVRLDVSVVDKLYDLDEDRISLLKKFLLERKDWFK